MLVRDVARQVGLAAMALGLVIVYFGFYELVGTGAMTAHHQDVLRVEFARQTQAPLPAPAPASVPAAEPGQPIARLIIPRIDLDVIVVEGVDLVDLAKGPGHYPETAPIGGEGTTAIAGHSSGWGAPFMHVGRLQPGDVVIFRTKAGTFTYRVASTKIVRPDAVWVLRGDATSRASHKLVLTTCWPLFTHRERLVIFADQVSTGFDPAT